MCFDGTVVKCFDRTVVTCLLFLCLSGFISLQLKVEDDVYPCTNYTFYIKTVSVKMSKDGSPHAKLAQPPW